MHTSDVMENHRRQWSQKTPHKEDSFYNRKYKQTQDVECMLATANVSCKEKKKKKKKQAQTINAYHYKDIIGVQSDVNSQEKNIKTLIQPDVVMYK